MSTFHPSKLSVTVQPPATFFQPIVARKYTLTHSDDTGELFLDIGLLYNDKAIDITMRDEVLAEWRRDAIGTYQLVGKVLVDIGENDEKKSRYRFQIFRKEMETAIKGIVVGDRKLYNYFPFLLDAPIFIHYESIFPQYNQVLYHGTPRQYL
ncbi:MULTISPECIES: staygreen family protein [Bacillaceae]|uniref:Staygreen family protein n=1 Tax=Evansella alkalicola TaxID=745819 RepID=A0ABS6JXK5_9BACI|nr:MULTISPECIES: staygreen family protein [Bacillaceae]MBU9723326.1 staygreen family protein [Bacillus alkalicola]